MCIRFLGDPSVRVSRSGRLFKLLTGFTYLTSIDPADLGYEIDLPMMSIPGPGGEHIAVLSVDVPAGFVSDGISSPRWAWSIIPPIGTSFWAGVVHDYLYTTHKEGRPWADKVFLEASAALGENRFVRYTSYAILRAFGRKAWDDSDKGWDE